MRRAILFVFAAIISSSTAACGDGPSKKAPFLPPNNQTTNNQTTANNDTTPTNVGAACGNGILDPAETCDPAIGDGEGTCPASCSSRACTTATLIGSASACTAECIVEPVGCIDADGCCTAGCTPDTDSDCSEAPSQCGNGTTEPGELCDADCPSTCPAGPSACQPNVIAGSAATCDARCVPTTITACQSGDGCCPDGCTNATDSDCVANCTPETCESVGAACGNPPDGCGARLNCGGCSLGDCTDQYECSNIGEQCTDNSDCIAGELAPQCLTSEPGGYCTATCGTNDVCPGAAWCSASLFQDGVCNGNCTSNADCRTEYECREFTDGDPNTLTCLPRESN